MLKISKQALIAAVVIAAASAPSNAFGRVDFEPSQAPARSAAVNPTQLHRAKPSASSGRSRSGARARPEGSPVRSRTPRVLRIMPRLPHRAASSGTTPGSAPQECSGSSEPRGQLRPRTAPPQAPDTRHLKRPRTNVSPAAYAQPRSDPGQGRPPSGAAVRATNRHGFAASRQHSVALSQPPHRRRPRIHRWPLPCNVADHPRAIA